MPITRSQTPVYLTPSKSAPAPSTSTSSGSTSSSTPSGSGYVNAQGQYVSSSGNQIGSGGGFYNKATGTYIDKSGKTYSTASAPKGAVVVNQPGKQSYFSSNLGGGKTAKGNLGGSSGGGYSYVDSSTGKGYEVSPQGVKTEVKGPTSSTLGIGGGNLGMGMVNSGTAFFTNSDLQRAIKREEDKEKTRLIVQKGTGFVLSGFYRGFEGNENKEIDKLGYSQQLPYQQRGTIVSGGPVATTQDLWRLGYRQQAGKEEIAMLGFTQQNKLDQIANQKANDISNRIKNEGQSSVDSFANNLQNRVNDGKISVTQAQKELDTYVKNTNTRLNERFSQQFNSEMKPVVNEISEATNVKSTEIFNRANKIGKEYATEKFVSSALVGVGIGLVSVIAPPVGLAIAGVGALNLATSIPETVQYAKQDPWGFGANIAGGLAGGIGGGFIGKGMVKMNNIAKVNNYATNKNLKLSDIETSYSLSNSRAVKVGVDYNGKPIWNVQQKVLTRFINKKTGALIDKSSSIGNYRVVADTASKATKSVIDGFAMSFRNNGFRLSFNGNKFTAKGSFSQISGQATTYQVGENLYGGRGLYDISSGKTGLKVTNSGVKFTADVFNPPRQSATSTFIAQRVGKTPKKITTPYGNIYGTKEYFATGGVTDIFQNYYVDKAGKIKYYKSEPPPVRDISKGFVESYEPKKFGYDTGNYDFSGSGSPSLIQQYKLSSKASSKIVGQSALQSQASSFANDVKIALVGEAKNLPPPKISTTQGVVVKSAGVSTLTGFSYPTYIDTGAKVGGFDWSRIGMTGKVTNDFSDGGFQEVRGTTGRNDLRNVGGFDFDSGKYKYNTITGTTKIGGTKINPVAKPKVGGSSINNILLGSGSVMANIQLQPQQYKMKELQITRQQYKIPSYNITRPTFVIPPFYFPKPPRSSYSYNYPTRSGRTRTGKRAYAPSLSAYQLTIKAPRGYKTKQQFSGLEIRPLVDKTYYMDLTKAYTGKTKKSKIKKYKKSKNNYGYEPVKFDYGYKPSQLNKLLIGY